MRGTAAKGVEAAVARLVRRSAEGDDYADGRADQPPNHRAFGVGGPIENLDAVDRVVSQQ